MDSSTCDFNVVTSTGLYFSFLCALWLFLYSLSPTGTDLFTLSSLVTAVPPCCHGPLGPLRWASVTHDCTSHSCTMEHRTLYELLGLDARAKKQDIKLAYRRLAKLYHPDKNTSPQATALFQELNQAYHTLTDDKLRVEYDALIGVCEPHTGTSHGDSVCVKSLTNVTINIRENIMSVTIDITDIMFLAFVEQCEQYYGMQPIDRGHHGLQFKFEYHSPLEPESYGSISLTFYPSTSRLLVQGSSYLLWVEEHLPSIYSDTESEFITHTSKWAFLTRQRGIGRKREHRPLSNATRAEMAVTTDTLPVCKPAVSSSTTATVCTPAVSTSTATAPCTPASVVSAGLEAAPFASAESSSATAAMHAPAIPVSTAMSISTTAVTHAPVSSSGRATVTDTSESYCPSDAVNPVVEPHTPTAMHGSSSASPAASPAEAAEILTSPETVTQAAGPTTRQAFKAGATMDCSTKCRKRKKETCSTRISNRKGKKNVPTSCSANVNPCQPGCNVTSKEASDMIRCSLCMSWYHNVCVGEDRRYVGVWTCVSCRRLPTLVLNLQTQVTDLASSLAVYQENDISQKDIINRLKAENNRLSQKVSSLEKTNDDLSKLIQTMSDVSPPNSSEASSGDPPSGISISVPTSNKFAALSQFPGDDFPSDMPQRPKGKRVRFAEIPRQTVPPVSVTVIGSSIVRGVAPLLDHSDEYNVDGFVYPGRTAKQINGSLKHIPMSDITVVSAGSNDIETQSVQNCVNEIKKVVDNISRKRRGKTVIMCQVPHRYDKPQLNNKIDDVNARVAEEIKKYTNVHILTHTIVRADFKNDLLHFNERGVAKFALQIRHVIRKLTLSK